MIKQKRSPRTLTQSEYGLFSRKRSQAELITTVLLILVAIAAVVIVSTFVINMVRDYLKPTDCFKTTGQLTINTEYSNYTAGPSPLLYLSISRGEKYFNLSAINVVFGDGYTSKKVRIIAGEGTATTYRMYSNSGFSTTVTLPDTQETKTYAISTSSLGGVVTKVSIAPSIVTGGDCKEADSKDIASSA